MSFRTERNEMTYSSILQYSISEMIKGGLNVDRLSQEEKNKFLFSYLVMAQQTSALISLGQVKDPITQELKVNFDNAQLAIDLLEMLQEKTRNNLSKDESDLLQNTLQQVRLAYVKEANKSVGSEKDKKSN